MTEPNGEQYGNRTLLLGVLVGSGLTVLAISLLSISRTQTELKVLFGAPLIGAFAGFVLSAGFALWRDEENEKRRREEEDRKRRRLIERARFAFEITLARLERIEDALRGGHRYDRRTDFRDGGWDAIERDFIRECRDERTRLRTVEFFEDFYEFRDRFYSYTEERVTFGWTDPDTQGLNLDQREEARKVSQALIDARGRGTRARDEWERAYGPWENPLQQQLAEEGQVEEGDGEDVN